MYFSFHEFLVCFLLFSQDAADNDLTEEEEEELDFDNDNDDEVDELALSFNDVEVRCILKFDTATLFLTCCWPSNAVSVQHLFFVMLVLNCIAKSICKDYVWLP